MRYSSHQIEAFFKLLRSGLWNTDPRVEVDLTNQDWKAVIRMSMEQGVVGQIADGISKLPDNKKPPYQMFIRMLMTVKRIEDDNDRTVKLAAKLQEYLRKSGVETIVLKGIGMARNYPNPRHRVVGDIDLLTEMNQEIYDKGRQLLRNISLNEYSVEEGRRHAAYTVNGQMVELHGMIGSAVNKWTTKMMPSWSQSRLSLVHPIMNTPVGNIKLAPYQFDAIFVFLHFINHFIQAACGFRQLCDWVMMLYYHGDEVNVSMLGDDLKEMHLTRVWQIFASVAVKYLGMPVEKMLLYDGSGDKWAEKTVESIVYSCSVLMDLRKEQGKGRSRSSMAQHIRSFAKLLPVYLMNCRVFPQETFYSVSRYIFKRMKD